MTWQRQSLLAGLLRRRKRLANKPVTPELSDSAVDGVAKAMATISSFVVDEPLACSLAKISRKYGGVPAGSVPVL